MNKISFLLALKDRLSHLPQKDVEERLGFYSEIIEDRVEEGLSEEQAVASIGSVDEIAAQIALEIPNAQTTKQNPKRKKRQPTWVIVLIALGCPVWLSLLIAAFAVVLSLYIVAWSVVIAMWAAFGSLASCALSALCASVAIFISGRGIIAAAVAGLGMSLAGLSVLFFILSRAVTKGTILLTKKTIVQIKNLFTKKEEA